MTTIEAIQNRKSIREYKETNLSNQDRKIIDEACQNAPKLFSDTEVKFTFLENGEDIANKLDGTAGYSGVMIRAPHYLLITASNTAGAYKAAGYAGEHVVLELTKHGIGSCWIDGTLKGDEIKKILLLDGEDVVVGLLSVGYAQYDAGSSRVFNEKTNERASYTTESGYANVDAKSNESTSSNRMAIEELSYLKKWGQSVSADELEKRGYDKAFYYMRLAPSWGNRQPWKFILDGMKIVLVIERGRFVDNRLEELDAGIAMQYFLLSMNASGLVGNWIQDEVVDQEKYEIPDNYFVAGQFVF